MSSFAGGARAGAYEYATASRSPASRPPSARHHRIACSGSSHVENGTGVLPCLRREKRSSSAAATIRPSTTSAAAGSWKTALMPRTRIGPTATPAGKQGKREALLPGREKRFSPVFRRSGALRGGLRGLGDGLLLGLVRALGDLLDELGAEGGQVVRVAARDEPGVHVDLLVDPRAAGVLDVRPQRRERGERAAAHDVGLDEGPGAVADDRHGLALLEEPARERDRVGVLAQEVGVRDAAGQDEPVVVVDGRVRHGLVDRERVRLVQVVERLELARVGRDELGGAPGLLHRLPGLLELDLLRALRRDEEGDLLAVQFISHDFGLPGARRGTNANPPTLGAIGRFNLLEVTRRDAPRGEDPHGPCRNETG